MPIPGKIVTMLMTETKESFGGVVAPGEVKEVRSAPAYVGAIPEQKMIGQTKQIIDWREITFVTKGYPQNIIFVEGTADTGDMFQLDMLDLKEKMIVASREILKRYDTYKDFEEEYGMFCVSQYAGEPEKFFTHAPLIAALVKSEKEPLDEKEIARTLEASIKYGKNDLLMVDWDGAFIFDSSGAFEETIELLEIGNYQLLRYRILDFELDRRLNKLSRLLHTHHKQRFSVFKGGEMKEVVRKMIYARSRSIIEFEAVDRNVKLIGDWYSAKVFDLVEKKFHLDEWRRNIKEKFETLEDIYNMASENFALSFNKRMEIVLIFGWLILLIGWFVLLVLDFTAYFK
ncbi:hypothetical protein HYR65_00065 [Candidatus Azambacteria bacterium]|nr:hypothetical protein [Candidatus Azambacteria bacterium]